MTGLRRSGARRRALWPAALLLLAAGCTALDDYLPGSPFTPDQPEGEVRLVGEEDANLDGVPDGMYSDRLGAPCGRVAPGGTVFWGQVRNTGDVDVVDVKIAISVFNAAGGSLGTYSDSVYNGSVNVANPDDPNAVTVAGTSLAAEEHESGTFKVCTPVPFGAAARVEYRTSFVEVQEAPAQ